MTNERAKFEEWFDEYPGNVKGANRFIALAAWQASRVAALAEAAMECREVKRRESRLDCKKSSHRELPYEFNRGCSDCEDAIRSLAEAPK